MKTIHAHHLAVLNDLSLKDLQAPTPCETASPRTNQRATRVVELTLGVSPLELVAQVLAGVPGWPMREFLSSVFTEPEVELALTTPIATAMRTVMPAPSRPTYQAFPTYPVQRLRRAAEMASFWCALGREERAVLYVATLVRGIGHLLSGCVVGSASLDDILFTLVRPALHRLDDVAPRQGRLLRLCLGWGNADEVDACYVPRLQESVAQALREVQIGPATQQPAGMR